MELYYKELLSKPEELARQIANVEGEDTIDLIDNLNMLRRRAGANHPLTKAYEQEFKKRQEIVMQKEVSRHGK